MGLNDWSKIENLPENWETLVNEEVQSLARVWLDQSSELKETTEYLRFLERLERRIAIETGVIERLYTIDRGTTQLLIEQGFVEAIIPYGSMNKPVFEVLALIQDQKQALSGLFAFVAQHRQLSTSYIKQLHQLLTNHQDSTEALDPFGNKGLVTLLKGDWKKYPNNPTRPSGEIYYYCPPEQVTPQMEQLIAWHLQHEKMKVPPEVEAAWLHHRFSQIHPFQDGNGRVARCLASLVFIRAGWFPLVVTRDDRTAYIDALEAADEGNLKPLIDLFALAQRPQITRALDLSVVEEAEGTGIQSVIASIADKLRQTETQKVENQRIQTRSLAEKLFGQSQSQLESVKHQLDVSTKGLVGINRVALSSAQSNDPTSGYYQIQIVETAKKLDYWANLKSYKSWSKLSTFMQDSRVEILLSFHLYGREFRGQMACSACAYKKLLTDDPDSKDAFSIEPLTQSPFTFSYLDNEDDTKQRFKDWVDTAVTVGLVYLRKEL